MNKNPDKKIAGRALTNAFAVAAALALSAEPLWANAFRLPNQDPEAIARGDAFTATADDPSAIYYNPAGITQLQGQQISAGIYAISADTTYSSPAGSAKTDTTLQPVPQLYYVDTFTNVPLSVGFGVYAPYGLSLNWGNNTPFNTIAEQGNVEYLCMNPVVAWRISKMFSVGIGPNFNYSQASLQTAVPTPFNSDRINFNGAGWDVGYNAGLLFQPDPKWSFGLNYRSSTKIKYDGSTGQNTPIPLPKASASPVIPFPEFITGGLSFRPTPNWNFEFDLDWTKWSEVKSLTLNTPFASQTLNLDYQNSFIYEFGATRQLGGGYFASVGYEYSENSSPSATFNPIIPDSNLNLGGVGVGHHGKRWDWAASFQFAYGQRTVSGSPTQYGQTADGKYTTFNKAVNLSATYKF